MKMNIISAQYYKSFPDETYNAGVLVNINGENLIVPMDTANRHYAEILKQVADGDITIAEAD